MFSGYTSVIQEILSARRSIPPTEEELADPAIVLPALAEHFGCEHLPQLPEELRPEIAGLIPSHLACAYGVVPLAGDATGISVALVDPFKVGLSDDLTFALGRAVALVVADPAQVRRLLQRHYGAEQAALDAVIGESPVAGSEAIDETALTEIDLAQMAGQERVIRWVNQALAQAIRDRAADIHFEPFEREFRLRYRVDGALRELAPPPRALALPVISRLKVLANVNIAERRVPQDGRIRLTLAGRAVDLRLSTLPTQFGESVVLRVLDQSAGRIEMSELGLPEKIRTGVEAVIRRPNGIFIVTGPTGSGKTTTLYSCLKQLNLAETKILTVEDPVEYEIEGLMQVPVNPAAGLTFSRALRTFLRQDPDVVMVGEVRDAETAQIAIQASLTGHLVLTTLHTNDAASAVTRLVDLGVEPFLLASTVEAVLAQRLLRRICTACRAPYQASEALLWQLDIAPEKWCGNSFYRSAGCPECHGSGYRGRIGLFEFLPLTEALRELIVQGALLLDLKRQAASEGGQTLREAGIAALVAGDTSVEEVLKYT